MPTCLYRIVLDDGDESALSLLWPILFNLRFLENHPSLDHRIVFDETQLVGLSGYVFPGSVEVARSRGAEQLDRHRLAFGSGHRKDGRCVHDSSAFALSLVSRQAVNPL
jgi:hypothetical protein